MDPIKDLSKKWPNNKKKVNELYLYLNKNKDSENHTHIFFHEKHKRWYYNIKCNNNKGNDRIRYTLRKPYKIRERWRKECPDYFKSNTKKINNKAKNKTVKKSSPNK